MSKGMIMYWLAKHPDNENEYIGTNEGVLVLFTDESSAKILLNKNGFSEAKLHPKTKLELIEELGKNTLVFMEQYDESSSNEPIIINELPEYNM